MTKRERLEDLGKLSIMLKNIINNNLFLYADSKHGYEEWKKYNHDKLEYFEPNGLGSAFGEPRGLEAIFADIRWLNDELHECLYLASGADD